MLTYVMLRIGYRFVLRKGKKYFPLHKANFIILRISSGKCKLNHELKHKML